MKLKKVFYLIIFLLLLFVVYLIFMTTDFYMPKSKKIENPKQLTFEIVKEVMKEVKVDTLFLIIDNSSLICGNEGDSKTKFQKKFDKLKYAFKSQYYFDKANNFEALYKNGEKVIVTGTSSTGPEGCGCFQSSIIYFDPITLKNKSTYEVKYNLMSKNDIEIVITNFSNEQEIKSMNFTLENGKWKAN